MKRIFSIVMIGILVCIGHPGAAGQPQSTNHGALLGSNTYCDEGLCSAGEGDCDNDSQCAPGLTCVNNQGAKYGFRAVVDVCEAPVINKTAGSNTFCDDGLCSAGEGDCDFDSQCAAGLVCSANVGSRYGFRAVVDVCEAPAMPARAGSNNFCNDHSCGAGEGDCDSDAQCDAGLICVNNVGASYGYRAVVDVCQAPLAVAVGSNSYCNRVSCGVGQGDCDSDAQCLSGLVCVSNVGANYGFGASTDVCEVALAPQLGSNTYCRDVLCGAGEGDCDSDAQCLSDLVCVDNVGAKYGFRPSVDVCEGSGWVAGEFEDDSIFEGLCAAPRTGINPRTGFAYRDSAGSFLDENNWLRSWSNDLYLWYDEILDINPAHFPTPVYFHLLRTLGITESGADRDKFHFSLNTDEWIALSQSGSSAGYGVTFAILSGSPPRQVVVAYTDPGTPATSAPANLARGAQILEVDGVDVVNGADIATLNSALFPSAPGASHEFVVLDLGAATPRTFVMQSSVVTSVPVQNIGTIETATGTVGYMLFNDHIATAEGLLVESMAEFQALGVSDLILDVRYNGGGFLAIASELAYMIAGGNATAGQVFEGTQFNDKHRVFNPVTGQLLTPMPFYDRTLGFSTLQGRTLPALNLSRVFLLTGAGTCSASESIINGLRGVDVEVIQIGSTTCGKPYGFYPEDNCGTTYFTIQFRGVNQKGFGDYTDGFSPANSRRTEGSPVPGCSVADDYTHALGDANEARLAAALAYRASGTCPTPSGFASRSQQTLPGDLSAVEGVVIKSPWLSNRIYQR